MSITALARKHGFKTVARLSSEPPVGKLSVAQVKRVIDDPGSYSIADDVGSANGPVHITFFLHGSGDSAEGVAKLILGMIREGYGVSYRSSEDCVAVLGIRGAKNDFGLKELTAAINRDVEAHEDFIEALQKSKAKRRG